MNHRITATLLAAMSSLGLLALPGHAHAATVGYYEMCSGTGTAAAAAAITAAGQVPVNVNVPDAATLATLDILFVTNCNNNGYGGEYTANLAAINNAVQNQGLLLMIHDRYVTGAGTILPGVVGTRDFSDGANIDFPVGSPIITGPGGTLTNASLDGGSSSSHGYVATDTMPAGAKVLAQRSVATQAVTFTYKSGAGRVVYSTIPLDYYLGGSSPAAFRSVYAPNVIAWAAGQLFVSCAAEGYTGAKRTLCHQICEVSHPAATLSGLIRVWKTVYRIDPPCAN